MHYFCCALLPTLLARANGSWPCWAASRCCLHSDLPSSTFPPTMVTFSSKKPRLIQQKDAKLPYGLCLRFRKGHINKQQMLKLFFLLLTVTVASPLPMAVTFTLWFILLICVNLKMPMRTHKYTNKHRSTEETSGKH